MESVEKQFGGSSRFDRFWATSVSSDEVHNSPIKDDPPTQGDIYGISEATLGDDLLNTAVELSRNYSKLSTSLLQRRLRIGYPRAARLMDQLEEYGIVRPGDGPKSREVIELLAH